MAKQFEYLDSSSNVQVVTSLELRGLAKEGVITKATSVREVGGKEWTKAGDIKGLDFSPPPVEPMDQGPVFHVQPKDDWERLANWSWLLANIHNLTGGLMLGGGVFMLLPTLGNLPESLVWLPVAFGFIAGSIPFFCLGVLLWAVELYAKGRSGSHS